MGCTKLSPHLFCHLLLFWILKPIQFSKFKISSGLKHDSLCWVFNSWFTVKLTLIKHLFWRRAGQPTPGTSIAWQAKVHGVTKSQTWLKRLSTANTSSKPSLLKSNIYEYKYKRILKITSLVKTHISSLIERHLFINCLVN